MFIYISKLTQSIWTTGHMTHSVWGLCLILGVWVCLIQPEWVVCSNKPGLSVWVVCLNKPGLRCMGSVLK